MQSFYAGIAARQSPCRGLLAVFRATTAASFIQTRGKKQKFGGITRDPFKTFQKKLMKQQRKTHSLKPIMSEERAQMELAQKPNLSSLGTYRSSLVPRPHPHKNDYFLWVAPSKKMCILWRRGLGMRL